MKTQASTGTVVATLAVLVATSVAIQQFVVQAAPPARSTDTRRAYYIAPEMYSSTEAPAACAAGYHMASIFEISDTSNLRYDTALGAVYEDSGSGPPLMRGGWVRSGARSNAADNCEGWTTNASDRTGLYAALSNAGGTPKWQVVHNPCDGSGGVWCVQD